MKTRTQVVSTTGYRVPRATRRLAQSAVLAALIVASYAYALDDHALPVGGSITAGIGSIAQDQSVMQINQATQNLVVEWNRFDIGAAARVNFTQPNAAAVALNRVVGSDASQIFGRLTSNGRVFLINPNGVLFGASARVDVGSLVASTLDISDADFLAGRRIFKNAGAAGTVINQGEINAAEGGHVALLAPEVRNQGVITARLGSVALAAGNQVTLDTGGDGLLTVTVNEAAINALAANQGLIQADGGLVHMAARSAGNVLATAVNNEGIVRARGLVERNGRISLVGGEEGVVVNAGSLDARGGSIAVSGQWVGNTGTISANDGGKIRVDSLRKTVMMPTSVIEARGGGEVRINQPGAEGFTGAHADTRTAMLQGAVIDTTGGADNGFVEVSGAVLDVDAGTIRAGFILFDPLNITFSNVDDANTGGFAPAPAPPPPGDLIEAFTDQDGLNSNFRVDDQPGVLKSVAAASTITFEATNNITVSSAFNLNTATTQANVSLVLKANNDITLIAPVTADGSGSLSMTADSGMLTVNADLLTGGGRIFLQGAEVTLVNGVAINAGVGQVDLASTQGKLLTSSNNAFTEIRGGDVVLFAGGNALGNTMRLDVHATTSLSATTSSGAIDLRDAVGDMPIATINAGTKTVTLTATAGAITDVNTIAGAPNVIAASLTATAKTGIDLDTQVASLTTTTNSTIGATAIDNTGAALIVVGMNTSSPNGDKVGAGSIRLTNDNTIQLGDGSRGGITLYGPEGVTIEATSGDITARGPGSGVNVIDSGARDINVTAAQNISLGSGIATNGATHIKSTTGTITLLARNGDVVIDRGSTVGSTSGTVSITAGSDILLQNTNALSGANITAGAAVTLTATNGQISGVHDATADVIGGTLQLSAVNAVNGLINLDTRVDEVGFRAGGDVTLYEVETGDALRVIAHTGLTESQSGGVISITTHDDASNAGHIVLDTDTGLRSTGPVAGITLNADGNLVMNNGSSINGLGQIDLTAGIGVALGQVTGGAVVNVTATAGAISDNTFLETANIRTGGTVTLVAGTGIGATGAGGVDTDLAGTGSLSLTTRGVGAAGNLWLAESGSLATSKITLTTHASAQTVSLTSRAATIAIDDPIGNATDNLTLDAPAGNIVSAAPSDTATANVLTLNAGLAIGAVGPPIPTVAATLDARSGAGAIRLSNTGAVSLTANATGGLIDVQNSGGALTITHVETPDNVTLGNSGTVKSAAVEGTADVIGATVNITATAIGTSGVSPLEINATILNTDTRAINDHQFITDTTDGVAIGLVTAGTGNVTLSATGGRINSATPDGTADVVGAGIDLNAATGIGLTGALDITGTSVRAVSTNGKIDLDSLASGAVTVISLSTGTGDIQFDQSGNQTLGVTLAQTTSGDITISNDSALVLGNLATSSAGNLAVTAAGTITQTGASVLTITGTTNLTAGATNDITLDNTGNNFTGAVTVVSANDVTLQDATGIILGSIATTDVAGPPVDTGDLAITANGTITQTGASVLTITGTTSLTAGATNDITLDNGNQFGGAVTVVSANDVTLQDATGIILGSIATSDVAGPPVDTGDLAITANGTITQTGASVLTTTGTTRLSAGAANDITLDNGNRFGGDVTVVSGHDVTLNDTGAIQFGAASTISRNLVVTADGAITDGAAGTLAVTGTTRLTAGATNDITLDNTGNNFTGAVSVISANDVTLRDNAVDNLVVGIIHATGTVTLTAGAAISDGNATATPDITAANLVMDAQSGIGDFNDPLETTGVVVGAETVLNLAARTVHGDIAVFNTGHLHVATVGAIAGVTIVTGGAGEDIRLMAASPLTVDAGSPVVNNGGGNINLAAQGNADGDDLSIAAAITATGGNGNITLHAGDDIFHNSGLISVVGNGNIDLNAGVDYNGGTLQAGFAGPVGPGVDPGKISQTSGTLIQAANGLVRLLATDDVLLSQVTSNNAVAIRADHAFGVLALNNGSGAINDVLISEAANITAPTVTLTAATGIGASGAVASIETIAGTVNAGNSTSVGIFINSLGGTGVDAGPVNFDNITANTAGNIELRAATASTLTSVTAAAGSVTVLNPLANITLAGVVSGHGANAVVLSTGANFINNFGAGAVVVNPLLGERWLIYSNSPANDVFGGLDSGRLAVWNATYELTPLATHMPPAAVTPGENRYLFFYQPTAVVFQGLNLVKPLGTDATTLVGTYTSGWRDDDSTYYSGNGAGSAYVKDSIASFTGAIEATSTGSGPAVVAGVYPINLALGTLVPINGNLIVRNPGTLTVLGAAASVDYEEVLTQVDTEFTSGADEVLPIRADFRCASRPAGGIPCGSVDQPQAETPQRPTSPEPALLYTVAGGIKLPEGVSR